MKAENNHKNLSRFLVQDYEPGFCIDFRNPPPQSDIDKVRAKFHLDGLKHLSELELLDQVATFLIELELADDPRDFYEGLKVFAHREDVVSATNETFNLLFPSSHAFNFHDRIGFLLHSAGLTRRPEHHPTRYYCHIPNQKTLLDYPKATHFGYLIDGETCMLETRENRRYPIHPGHCFSWSGSVKVSGNGRMMLITRFNYEGHKMLVGEIPGWGRLKYIDGCTDNLLIPPAKKGDACLNSLYFPEKTVQTRHYHPSIRAGVIIGGKGRCRTPSEVYDLQPGNIFFMPAETWHAFETDEKTQPEKSVLTVLAYHPDSDFGPSDEDHPMLNRTFFQFLHRLRSQQRL